MSELKNVELKNGELGHDELEKSEWYAKLQPYLEKAYALKTAQTILNWDNNTAAPKEAMEYTSKAIGLLYRESYDNLVNDEVKEILAALSGEKEQKKLTSYEKAIVKNLRKEIANMEVIPSEEYQAFQMLLAKAYGIWEQAKNENDYNMYAPILEEIIDYTMKFAEYKQKEGQNLYDVLLDEFEEGFTVEILDEFFGKLREALLPLVQQIGEKTNFISRDCLHQQFCIDTQKQMSKFLAEYIGLDFDRCVMAESAHPFTTSLHNRDVRITNHYQENALENAIFSVIHEGGHALYELDIDDAITLTPIGGGTSMGMHESQSRFYENNLGRSHEFWEPIYESVQQLFPEQLEEVSLDDFYHAINYAAPSLIRTASDELTYSFHIMIRYEMEKLIFEEKVDVKELPKLWNQKYEEYLGVTPENDSEGILQDVHWAGGSFGYFPSYALGSAIAAQLYHYMEGMMPLKDYLREGNLAPVREFLKDNIHKYGGAMNTQELLKKTTGEKFNPEYYIQYLTDKFRTLYEL